MLMVGKELTDAEVQDGTQIRDRQRWPSSERGPRKIGDALSPTRKRQKASRPR
jgi:hypothetical protein